LQEYPQGLKLGSAQSNHFAKPHFVKQMNKLQKLTTYLGNKFCFNTNNTNINFIHKNKKLNLQCKRIQTKVEKKNSQLAL